MRQDSGRSGRHDLSVLLRSDDGVRTASSSGPSNSECLRAGDYSASKFDFTACTGLRNHVLWRGLLDKRRMDLDSAPEVPYRS